MEKAVEELHPPLGTGITELARDLKRVAIFKFEDNETQELAEFI